MDEKGNFSRGWGWMDMAESLLFKSSLSGDLSPLLQVPSPLLEGSSKFIPLFTSFLSTVLELFTFFAGVLCSSSESEPLNSKSSKSSSSSSLFSSFLVSNLVHCNDAAMAARSCESSEASTIDS